MIMKNKHKRFLILYIVYEPVLNGFLFLGKHDGQPALPASESSAFQTAE